MSSTSGCVALLAHLETVTSNPYLKIALLGIAYCSAVSGLYSWMAIVDEVDVAPPTYKYNIFTNGYTDLYAFQQQGLRCLTLSQQIDQPFCDEVTEEMLNMTSQNLSDAYNITNSYTEWQCELFTDFSNKTLYDEIPYFGQTLLFFVICTGISAIFSIIHDWALIYYRNDLGKLIFYPQKHMNATIVVMTLYSNCDEDVRCACCLMTAILLLCGLIIEWVWMLAVYPWCILLTGSFDGFVYVSSSWIGISTGLMTVLAATILFTTVKYVCLVRVHPSSYLKKYNHSVSQ